MLLKNTIKREKQLRLDELIKYIFDNGIEDAKYHSSEIAPFGECTARISASGNIKLNGYINKHTTFTVEVEELITEGMVFKELVITPENKAYGTTMAWNCSIKDLEKDENKKAVYAQIDGELVKVWEADGE